MAQQRHITEKGNMITAGRDIGTALVPRAGLKVFPVASPEERTLRCPGKPGQDGDLDCEDPLAELMRNHEIDDQWFPSPSRPARDDKITDTEDQTPKQVADRVIQLAGGK